MEDLAGQNEPSHFPEDPGSPVSDTDSNFKKHGSKLVLFLLILVVIITLLNAGLSLFIFVEKYL